jgi:mannosyltransferase
LTLDDCRRQYWIALGIVTLGGAALRFATLDGQSFWFDEAVTRWLVRLPLSDMLREIPKTERTPPGYYVVAWFWVKAFGAGEVGLRSLSALLGTGVILATAAAASALATRRVALVAALLVAVNPLLVWYSQEARAYAMLALLSALGLLAFVNALDRPRARAVVAWSLISAAALVTHYFAVFLVVPEAVALLVLMRPRRLAVGGVAFVAAVGIALLPLLFRQQCEVQERGNAGSAAWFAGRLAKNDLVGFNIQGLAEAILAPLALAVVLLSIALIVRRPDPQTRPALFWAVAIGGIGALIPAALGVLQGDLLNERYLLGSLPILIVGLAAALGTRRAGRLGIAGVVVLTSVGLAAIALTAAKPEFQRQDWRGLTRELPPAASRAIIVSPGEDGVMSPEAYIPTIHEFPAGGAKVLEVDLAMLPLQPWRATRQPNGVVFTRHPSTLPTPPPATRDFHLVSRVDTKSFTVIRYRARAPVPIKRPRLAQAALDPKVRSDLLYVADDSPPTARSELDLGQTTKGCD